MNDFTIFFGIFLVSMLFVPPSIPSIVPIAFAANEQPWYYYISEPPYYAPYAKYSAIAAIEYWAEPNPHLVFMSLPTEKSCVKNRDMCFLIDWVKSTKIDGDMERVGFAKGSWYMQVSLGHSVGHNNEWQPYSERTLTRIATHEVGHILGLDHSRDLNSIMYPDIQYHDHRAYYEYTEPTEPTVVPDRPKILYNRVNIQPKTDTPGCESSNSCHNPHRITITQGEWIKWKNLDIKDHAITSGGAYIAGSIFDSSLIKSGSTFSHLFTQTGTYSYFCTIHPWATGVVVVKSGAAIPNWIKNNAEWWASDKITDSMFLKGIQHLIKEGIMVIPPTYVVTSGSSGSSGGSQGVPAWIKNNAGWWADGQIDDSSFLQGIQYLVKEGIIKVS